MDFEYEKNLTLRFLTGLEEGDLPLDEVYRLAEKCDPTAIYFVVKYLRAKYPADHGAVQRIVELSSQYVDIPKIIKNGEDESLREWFDDAYDMREFFSKPDEFVNMIVDKVEG